MSEKQQKQRRFMLAAPSSGSGKTVVTCGLLRLLQQKEIPINCLKCGPDYIDPMFHQEVMGIAGGNIDSFFLDAPSIRNQAAAQTAPDMVTVLEGVMGYYDGMGGTTTSASSYEIAAITGTPVILVVDAKGSSVSVCALIKGFLAYRSDHQIKGVILNRTSAVMAKRLQPLIEELGICLVGYLPFCQAAALESRHLGLVTPMENQQLRQQIDELAATFEHTIDFAKIYEIAGQAEQIERIKTIAVEQSAAAENLVKIGIAKDQAFCFYYQENLKLLEALGAVLIPFSPIHDETLPEGIGAVILGGGYPELYAKELQDNNKMKQAILAAYQAGMPIAAECGGFLYLHKSLEGKDGHVYQMTGIIDAAAYRTKLNKRFGYIELASLQQNDWIKAGETIKGHEFHYWESSDPGSALAAKKPVGGKEWQTSHVSRQLLAGFPHLYYPSNPKLALHLLTQARKYLDEAQTNR